MTHSNNRFLDAAHTLASLGFSIFPASRKTKAPIIEAWPEQATTDSDVIEGWWREYPNANPAIACGKSDILVVDEDPRHGGDATIANLLREYDSGFVRTVTATTGGGGHHYYFRTNGMRFKNTNSLLGPGVDTRAINGLVIGVGSRHQSGRFYEWDAEYSPNEREMLPVPPFLIDLLPAVANEKRKRINIDNNIAKSMQGGDVQVGIPTCIHLSSEDINNGLLRDIDKNEIFVRHFCDFIGVPSEIKLGSKFHCVLPGHAENKPSASLGRTDTGYYYYHDWHYGRHRAPEILTLAEVYAATVTGRVEKQKSPPLHATWKLRMLVEMGVLPPATVPMPPLPQNASESLRCVYEGFRYLLACRWTMTPNAPAPFTWRFGANWCGVAPQTAQQGIQKLYAMGIIEQVDSTPGAYGKDMALYLPCGMQ